MHAVRDNLSRAEEKARSESAAVSAAEAPPLSPVDTRPRAKILRASVNMQPEDVATPFPTTRMNGAEFAARATERMREIEDTEECFQSAEDLLGKLRRLARSRRAWPGKRAWRIASSCQV